MPLDTPDSTWDLWDLWDLPGKLHSPDLGRLLARTACRLRHHFQAGRQQQQQISKWMHEEAHTTAAGCVLHQHAEFRFKLLGSCSHLLCPSDLPPSATLMVAMSPCSIS